MQPTPKFSFVDEFGTTKSYRQLAKDRWLARAVFQGTDSGWTPLEATDDEVAELQARVSAQLAASIGL